MSYSTVRSQLIVDGHCSAADALEFFKDLYDISHKKIPDIVGGAFKNDFPTKQYRGPGGLNDCPNGWKQETPLGVCDHFTADCSLASTLRWFSSHEWPQPDGSKRVGRASSEIVIDLDGTPYVLVRFWDGCAAWHEPQLNGLTVGIEHVCVGEVKQDGAAWTYWPNDWKRPYPLADVLPPVAVDWRGAKWMAPFTREQVITNLVIKRALVCLYDSKMRPELFVDHAMYRDDKLDCGPLWPLETLRRATFAMDPLDAYTFMHAYTPVRGARMDAIDDMDLAAINADAAVKGLPMALDAFPNASATILWTQLALGRLGYVLNPTGRHNQETTDAVKKFQRAEGLTDDGIPGPQTRAALMAKR